MARKHSKLTVILVAATDISQYCDDSTCEKSAGTEDNTTYGKNAQVFDPTLLTGAFSCSGKYDSTASTGPRALLMPLVGTSVTIKHRPEGTGSGLPQDSFTAVITKYTETAPIGGYRKFALDTQPSDDWDQTAQA